MVAMTHQQYDDDNEGGWPTIVPPGSELWVDDAVLLAFSLLPPSKVGCKYTYENLSQELPLLFNTNQPDNPVGLFHVGTISTSA